MRSLNSYRLYELGAKLHSLFGANNQSRVSDMFVPLTETQALLDGFIKGDTFVLETSKADATRLLNKISALFNRYFIDPATKQLKSSTGEDRIDAHEFSMVGTLVEKFEHALAAELNRVPAYVADKRGIYSTYDLAENAQAIFSDSLRAVIPAAAQNEFNAAGRALAFGLGTASAVHMLRSVEIVLKIYYEFFAGTTTAKSERNYAIYLKKLAALLDDENAQPRPDKRVVQMLAQIKDHYRNPLVSPENTISIDEATAMFGMVSALVSLMAEQIQTRTQTEKAAGKIDPLAEDDDMYDFRMSQAG